MISDTKGGCLIDPKQYRGDDGRDWGEVAGGRSVSRSLPFIQWNANEDCSVHTYPPIDTHTHAHTHPYHHTNICKLSLSVCSLISLCAITSQLPVVIILVLIRVSPIFCKGALSGSENERSLEMVNKILTTAFTILGLYGEETGKSQNILYIYMALLSYLLLLFSALFSSRVEYVNKMLPQMLIVNIKKIQCT